MSAKAKAKRAMSMTTIIPNRYFHCCVVVARVNSVGLD